jgi:hypothetical protein
MNMLRNLLFGAVAFTGLALATPVHAESVVQMQSRDDHSHHYYFHGGHYYGQRYYWSGKGWVYTAPYYNYDPYWYPPVPTYGYQPGFTIALGGFPWFHVHQKQGIRQ